MALSRHDCTWRYKGVPGDELPRAVAQLLRIPRDRLQVPLSLSRSLSLRSFPLLPLIPVPRSSYPRANLYGESFVYLYPTYPHTRAPLPCVRRVAAAHTRASRIRPKVLEHTRVIRLLFPVASCGIVRAEPGTYFRRRANCTTSRRPAVPANTENMTRSHYKLALSTLPLSAPYIIRLHHRAINRCSRARDRENSTRLRVQ